MILVDDILELHKNSIRDYGGSEGIRDFALLESAIARPFQSFDGITLYTDIYSKAAALLESLIVNHPFVDGNKRTGFAALVTFLYNYQVELTESEEEIYSFIIRISTSEIKFEGIVDWLKNHSATNL